MTTKSDFAVLGLVHKLGLAWEGAGGKRAEMNTFAENGPMIRDLLAVIRCNAEINIVTHVIDCAAQPMIHRGWSIQPEDQIASRFQGELVWSPEKIRLHIDDAQTKGMIVGNELLKKLEGQPVLPANVGDYLLDHPALIPPDWKWKYTYFWGTLCRDPDGNLCVRCLRWDGRNWGWYGDQLGRHWRDQDSAALLAA